MIIFDGVTKRYGTKKVLDNVSFEVQGGEFVTIVGSSGAGKSTLLHALIGAIKIDKGNIDVDHYRVNSLNSNKIQEYRRRVGIVFQDYKLLPKKPFLKMWRLLWRLRGMTKNLQTKGQNPFSN